MMGVIFFVQCDDNEQALFENFNGRSFGRENFFSQPFIAKCPQRKE